MIAHNAESARGISPRAAHRSGREPLGSRFSSSVPEPGIESRHLCTGHHMASKQVSAMLVPGAEGTLRFRCRESDPAGPPASKFPVPRGGYACVAAAPLSGPAAWLATSAHRVSDRAGSRCALRWRRTRCCLPPISTASASRSTCCLRSRAYTSRLNTRPVRPSVNVSTSPSRAAPHDSRPLGFARLLTYETFIHNTLPV
jgi:hypothetical protein